MQLTGADQRRGLLERARTIAVVGASPNPARPSFDVFVALKNSGRYTLAPITPAAAEVAGVATFPSLTAYAQAHGAPDVVDVFRNPEAALEVATEAIAVGARAIWFQLGVVNPAAIEAADAAGLDVVVDRCIKVDLAELFALTALPAYRAEADALDARILAAIADYALDPAAFDRLACDVCAHQLRWNAPYAAYARSLGYDAARPPARAVEIPAVPAAAFKDAVLSTAPERAALWFETSGTTVGRSGRHVLESARLYDAALLAGFDHALLADGALLRYALLVPDPRERPHSSLGHMMATVARERGDGHDGWYLHDDRLDVARFCADAARAAAEGVGLCIATTAFALVALLDELAALGRRLRLPPGSRVMETGGFKGRTRIVARDELYGRAADAFAIGEETIVAEYGMTELSSQYYDAPSSRATSRRVKQPVPWLRPIVVGVDGVPLAPGIVGAIRHVDCANRSSVVAIETEDLGVLTADGALLLLGREADAPPRGCSLDAEDLVGR